MKRMLPFLLFIFLYFPLVSQTTEVVSKKEFQDEKKKLNQGIDQARKTGTEAKRIATKQAALIDSLKAMVLADQSIVNRNNDSLAASNGKIVILKERFDMHKARYRMFTVVIVLAGVLLFALSFVLLFRWRNKFNASVAELQKDVSALKEVNHAEHDKISALAEDLKRKLLQAVEQEEKDEKELAAQIAVLLTSLNEKSQTLVTAMEDLKTDHGKKLLQHDEKVKEIGSSVDTRIREVEKRVIPVVEKQKEIHGLLADEFRTFRSSLEKEVRKLAEELTAHVRAK